ncbi:carboxy terminal-processing peptidase [Methylococcus sp. EFPC2]|uniref:carboxy terminal-processing peptidase n=1 Tax=Methylococcus sp. EFPC2 TaxID=2812648 RepID=UPI00196734D6|nr:carboxy terminal-processing peptidase [Methylococcus sp. EFPC2]QSA95560.1 carboxy terminal-processing peptidase [Methylococcus sp. EFPC2]
MNRKLIWLALAFAAAVQANAPGTEHPPYPVLKPLQQQTLAAHLTAELIGEHHYKPVALNDALSEKIFDAYLKSLDPERMLFIRADVDGWQEARTKLDDAVLTDNLDLPFAIFNLYAQRAVERYTYARSLLKTGFEFQQNDNYQFLREKEPWAKSEDEIRDLWRKRVKSDWLQLKLAGKDDKNIVEVLDKRYENFLKRIGKLKSDDAFQIFMNAYTMSVDPHTNYLGPRTKEDFGISMKLSLVGIGAVLEEKDDYATIKELMPGSPAALSEKLKAGDRIAGVAQGEKGALTDVVGWRLDDTVALIRGEADSVVVLDIVPAGANPDSEHKLVTLVRKKIRLEDQAAKKTVLSLADKGVPYRIGVITLPTFYEDFQARQNKEPDYKSATRDVSRLLEELKAEKVDAVLVDLRNNGGGSLTEAVELTGLFVGAGPVVQQRDASGKVNVAKGVAPGAVWDGPLGVLINRGSASASEIFAAAIQDYRRGLVIGETSFGKGTVQTVVNLNNVARTESPQLGDLKLTVAQFFRVNGGTTQLRGVTPDINLPATSDAEHFGESAYDNGLPWMRIKATDYRTSAGWDTLLPLLQQRHNQRVAKDKDYQYLLEDIAEFDRQRKKNLISLNESERRKEREAQEAKLKSRESATPDKSAPKSDTDIAKADPDGNKDGDDELKKQEKKAKDTLLREAAYILGDQVALTTERPGFASRAPSNSAREPKNQALQ